MLYSIVLETPVILSVEPLYATFGAALRAGTETARVTEANVVFVALTRTWYFCEEEPATAGILAAPGVTAVKAPDAPILYSMESFAEIDSVNPSNLMEAAVGAAGRRGSIIVTGDEAGVPPAALMRMLSVTSLRAVAEGIIFAMSSAFVVIAVHLAPLALYSMRLVTPVTVSLRVSSAMPAGGALDAKTVCLIPARITQTNKNTTNRRFFTIKALPAADDRMFTGVLQSPHPCVFAPINHYR